MILEMAMTNSNEPFLCFPSGFGTAMQLEFEGKAFFPWARVVLPSRRVFSVEFLTPTAVAGQVPDTTSSVAVAGAIVVYDIRLDLMRSAMMAAWRSDFFDASVPLCTDIINQFDRVEVLDRGGALESLPDEWGAGSRYGFIDGLQNGVASVWLMRPREERWLGPVSFSCNSLRRVDEMEIGTSLEY